VVRVRWCVCGGAMTCAHTLGGGWAAHALGSLTFPTIKSRSTVPPGMGFTEFAKQHMMECQSKRHKWCNPSVHRHTTHDEGRPTGIGQFNIAIAGELVQRVNHAVVRHPVGALVQTLCAHHRRRRHHHQ
jgi:hypothetical protein